MAATRDSDLSNSPVPSPPPPPPPSSTSAPVPVTPHAAVSANQGAGTPTTATTTTTSTKQRKTRSAQPAQNKSKSKNNPVDNTNPVPAFSSPGTDTVSASASASNKRKSQPRRQSSANTPAPPPALPATSTFQAHPIPPPAPVYHQTLPPHSRMNPPYPVNGSPYPHPHAPPPPGTYHTPHTPHNGVAHHTPAPYGYHPLQHYSPHQYHPYPGYSHPMMAYPTHAPPPPHAHPPPPQPSQSASPPAPSSASGSKRKRKGTADSGKKGSERMSDVEDAEMHKKRTKTQRACDSCRSRKIRCDVLQESEPPICQHCKQYSFECTFFLPITETRFKKKRQEEEAAAAVAVAAAQAEREKRAESEAQDSPMPEGTRGVRIDGPTSMTHLLHSTATVPPRAYQSYDLRYHHTWEVGKSGDGLIQVLEPTIDEALPTLSKTIDPPVERDVVEKLINSYFTDVAPLVPIVTQAEFLALSDPSPPPILLYSICLVAACKREVPQAVFDALRVAVNDVIKSEDVLCTASIVNVQSLLILCQCGDCHSPFVPTALSALWIRLGTAIRMAQDLGLHRAEAVKKNIEMRRRVWGACVITDRWTSLTYGHPYMIDVEDCDARLPSSGDPNDHYTDELLRLSLILGRVLKTIYSPSGLKHATDEKLHELLADMRSWKEKLPEDLQFRGPDTPRSGGLLHLLYACVSMIFWRVFMRISYTCPAHLKFGLTVDTWTELVTMTGESIDWLDLHEELYDVWMLVAYAATSCALVQYHTWARRKDAGAEEKLRKLRDCVRRWEKSLQPEHMSTRRKTAEIITLLYETTQGPPVTIEEPPALNPTGGVKSKLPSTYKGLKYKKDPSRPGGGVFVASGKAKDGDYSNIPEGVVIVNSDEESTEGEEQAAEVSTVQPTNDSASSSSARDSAPAASAAVTVSSPTDGYSQNIGGGMMMSTTTTLAADAAGDRAPPEQHTMSSMVTYTPLNQDTSTDQGMGMGAEFMNVNPSLNTAAMMGATDVQVMNVLDVPPAANTLEQFAVADSALLQGLPGSMFDWPQWDNFFSTRLPATDANTLALLPAAHAAIPMNGESHQHSSQPSSQLMYPENVS